MLILLIFSPHFSKYKSCTHVFFWILTTIISVFNFYLSGMRRTILLGWIQWERTICSSSSILLSAMWKRIDISDPCFVLVTNAVPVLPFWIPAGFLCRKRHEGSPVLRTDRGLWDHWRSVLFWIRKTWKREPVSKDRLREPSRLLLYRSNYQNDFVKHIEQIEHAGLGIEKSGSEPGWEDKMLSGEFHRFVFRGCQHRYRPEVTTQIPAMEIWPSSAAIKITVGFCWLVESSFWRGHALSCQPARAGDESWQHIRNSDLLLYNYLWLFSSKIQLNISVMAYHNIPCDNIPTV